jgi:hypothetical protein
MAFGHGLCFGRRQLTIFTLASPALSLTRWLCLTSQRLISLETCQEALSQIRSRTFFPMCWSWSQLYWRNGVVTALTDRPFTNLNHV